MCRSYYSACKREHRRIHVVSNLGYEVVVEHCYIFLNRNRIFADLIVLSISTTSGERFPDTPPLQGRQEGRGVQREEDNRGPRGICQQAQNQEGRVVRACGPCGGLFIPRAQFSSLNAPYIQLFYHGILFAQVKGII